MRLDVLPYVLLGLAFMFLGLLTIVFGKPLGYQTSLPTGGPQSINS